MGDGILEGIEEFGEGAFDYASHAVESVGGALVSEVAGVAGVAYHAGAGVYDAATGDWDGAADQALSMSESAIGVATEGVSNMVEGAFDIGNAAGGGDEHTSMHGLLGEGLHEAGDWLGDTAYELINGDGSEQ